MNASNTTTAVIDGEQIQISPELLARYSRTGPRYTSYPTAPQWEDGFPPEDFRAALVESSRGPAPAPLSLYFHLPFCHSLCLFCGCNVVISKTNGVVEPYLDRLEKEIALVSEALGSGRRVEQLHWGGGTPTFLTSEQIERLFTRIAAAFTFSPTAEISLEVEPRTTTPEQIETLRRLGFNRVSMGVQDFDPLVQKTVRRFQPYETTRALFDHCREVGFDSINVDLIYGLPHQSRDSFAVTVEKVIEMAPDRIALYSYAHVPWMKKQQGSFARHLPETLEKFAIFCMAIEMLTGAGYRYIGMDHFARPDDELSVALDEGTLHRNFQGYTTKGGCDLVAMGVTSISMLPEIYAQNRRDLESYYAAIDGGEWPTARGIRLSSDDVIRHEIINGLMCRSIVVKSEIEKLYGITFDEYFAEELPRLEELAADGSIRLYDDRIEVTPLGRLFVRNVAMIFDAYLEKTAPTQKIYSSTV